MLLSLFGLAMGLATVYWIPSQIEPFVWLLIFIVCAGVISRQVTSSFFLHGFFVSMVNSIWITIIHIILMNDYLEHHAAEARMLESVGSPEFMMALTGPLIGAISGIVLGTFSWLAGKWRR